MTGILEGDCHICPLAVRYYLVLGFSAGSGAINIFTLLKVYGVIP